MGNGARVAGSAALSLVDGARPLRPEPTLFEAMLSGWRRQQQSRRLSESIIGSRERTVRRFAEFTGGWPWCWSPAQLESWTASGRWAHSTVRSYQGAVATFLDYVCDPRYGWVSECEQRLGSRPVQICHEGNTAVHVADYEGRLRWVSEGDRGQFFVVDVSRILRGDAGSFELAPGDIVFFGPAGPRSRPATIGHAGIYLGAGWMIHSSGQGVAVTPLAGWYRQQFAWGRRPLAEAGLVGAR